MLRPTEKLQAFERRYSREHLARLSYGEALARFEALWREASALSPEFPGDWRDDLAPDLAMARALNGLPPKA